MRREYGGWLAERYVAWPDINMVESVWNIVTHLTQCSAIQ